MSQSVVILEKDPKVARSIVGGLRPHFHNVQLTRSQDELRDRVSKNQPEAVILDIECWQLAEVVQLRRDFPALPIICTHRVPDEELWMAAMEAGASDVCPSGDVANVLTSVLRNTELARRAAA